MAEVVVCFSERGTDRTWEGVRMRHNANVFSHVGSKEVIAGCAPKTSVLVSSEICLDGPPAPLAKW